MKFNNEKRMGIFMDNTASPMSVCEICLDHGAKIDCLGNKLDTAWEKADREILNLMEKQVLKAGEKHDNGKLRWELLPYDSAEGIVKVLTLGAQKYSPRNWECGIEYGRVYGAVMRHVSAWWRGENTDPESGLSHLDHALCELMFLNAFEKRGMKSFDDRPGRKNV